ncbi:hypothetical protein SSX86_031493 [Deinandra increscens subsp. villosa]|uniref:SWIM-type domain-containing protein n=1 Tax=Deinandra increscens subsp. villosa TaxID=3103831 RepID=A0AAP0C9S0_9ASTR
MLDWHHNNEEMNASVVDLGIDEEQVDVNVDVNLNVDGENSLDGSNEDECENDDEGEDSLDDRNDDDGEKHDDDEDSDFVPDESNQVNDDEADMRDYILLTENNDGEEMEVEMDEPMLDNDNFDNDEIRDSDCPFYIGQVFGTKIELKLMVKEHAVNTKRDIRVVKDDDDRVRAICKDPDLHKCPWVLLLSFHKASGSWIIRTWVNEHSCLQSRKIYSCTTTFLSKKLGEQIQENPKIPVRAVQEQFQTRFDQKISMMKAFRAKTIAMEQLHGDFSSQYGKLRDYVDELIRSNPGTTVKLEVEAATDPTSPVRKFKRIYVCLGSLKQGYTAIGRELLGLDGAFLKGPFPGQLLTAVGLDPNNGIYPLAYAIVEAETMLSWSWFLQCLADDLDLGIKSNYTFISDRQKGIIPALQKVFPCAEHRFCLRHILENMKQQYKGKIYKDTLWKLAKDTTVVHFQKDMDALKEVNSEAHLWLSKIPPQHWSRSHFFSAISDVLLNNMCEVLNSKLLDGRDKPIITMLEFVREYLTRRIVNVLRVIDKSKGLLTPYATKLMESIKRDANRYTAKWNGGDHYQVSSAQGSQYVVNMGTRTCACRSWEITGLPCRHAVAAIRCMSQFGEEHGSPESYADHVYRMERWKQVYSHKVYPINRMSEWSKSQVPTVIVPPAYHKPIDRPKNARKRSRVELEEGTKAGGSKAGKTMTCGKCKKKGHNRRSCKGQEQPG